MTSVLKTTERPDAAFYPPRATFHCPSPIGIGTPLAESLTSLQSRFAETLHVTSGTLVQELVIPHINKHYLEEQTRHGGTAFWKSTWTLNGTSENAKNFSKILNDLTGIRTIDFTTFLPWSQVLPSIGLLRKKRAWCPLCFQEMRARKQVYEPLLWSVKVVEICSKHNRFLTDTCPHCNAIKQLQLNRKTWAGHCSVCGHWLGNDCTKKMKKSDCGWAEWINQCVGAIIAAAPSIAMASATSANISSAIQEITEIHCDGRISTLAEDLHLPKNTVWAWYHGTSLPRLEAVIAICGRYSCEIVKFLSAGQIVEIEGVSTSKNSIRLKKNVRRKMEVINLSKTLGELRSLADSKMQAESMEQVARRLNCSKRVLYKHFPTYCKKISLRYRKYLSKKKRPRIEVSRNEIRSVISSLSSLCVGATYSRIRERLKNPSMLREKIIRAECFNRSLIPFTNTSKRRFYDER